MRAGRLNRTATLLRETQTDVDALGQPITAFAPVHTFWATLDYKSEAEPFAVAQRSTFQAVTIRCRFFDDLQMTDLIQIDDRRYDVKGWRQIGYREGLEIAAEWRQ